jgi:DNA invertase Pin-like site-specific DNA recombinase
MLKALRGRLMLTVLRGLAEFERELIRARTGEGRKRAKTRGMKFGRPGRHRRYGFVAIRRSRALARAR